MKFKKTKLANGLRIITVPMHETQTATVVILVGVGSRYEKQKEAGISHFVEHMFFKGTEKRPTALFITEELDSIGGEYNAFTGKDRTGYFVKVDAKHLDKALDVLSDLYLNAKIEMEEIEKEKGAIIQEFNMVEDMPIRKVEEEFEKLVYIGNPLGREILGTKETVLNFKRKSFVDYISRFYTMENTTVCIAGKINEKKAIQQIRKYFSKMRSGKSGGVIKVKERQKVPAVNLKFKETDQTHLIIGVRAYHENHPDRFALGLLSVILGGNMSSRLFNEVREKRGLAYYIRTGVESYADCGYLAAQAGVDHQKVEKTIEVVLGEYKKIANELVPDKEIQKAKDYIKGKMVMGLEASDEVAMFFIDQESKRRDILTVDQIFQKIDGVDAKKIQKVAKDIFRREKLNLAIIGPHRKSDKLLKLMCSF